MAALASQRRSGWWDDTAPESAMSGQKKGVGVVVRVRPTAQFAHGALMVDTERHTVDLKLDATHDDVVNNQVNRNVKENPHTHTRTSSARFIDPSSFCPTPRICEREGPQNEFSA